MNTLLRSGLLAAIASIFAAGCAAETDGLTSSSEGGESSDNLEAVSDELSTSGPTYAAGTELTTSANLNLRSAAATNANVLRVLPRGTRVIVTSESGANAWVAVKLGDSEGFAHTDYLMDDDDGGMDDDVASGDAQCSAGSEKAYEGGSSIGTMQLMKIGSRRATYKTGHAFLQLRDKMKERGVTISINSGFRTQSEQQYFYNCYRNGNCNNGNLAAAPGYSNHQNGRALDLAISNHTKFRQVLSELGLTSKWKNTVASERWHWEYFGSDPGGVCGN